MVVCSNVSHFMIFFFSKSIEGKFCFVLIECSENVVWNTELGALRNLNLTILILGSQVPLISVKSQFLTISRITHMHHHILITCTESFPSELPRRG